MIRQLIFICLIVVLISPSVSAFGAGNVPSFSFLEGKAFRHGDIEDTLAELIKKSGGFLGRSSKFGGLDISRVYFGNWLRDYSQAVDIAGLKKLSLQSILNLVMALGFLSHGYATGEFEVTKERLGVYSCVEHIDNPKGYGVDEPGGDARHLDPRLRGPVDARELEIDSRTGMKNYISNESGSWDTSSRLVRDRIRECINLGRQARATGSETDLFEAYRLLGTLLHTLEDFPAHSNFIELSLRRLGYSNVFTHTGDMTLINTPIGIPAPPLVTGTFGGSDFIHSLIGETSDHISEASVSDLSTAMSQAKVPSGSRDINDQDLATMLSALPDGDGNDLNRQMNSVEQTNTRDNRQMSPQEMHAALWKILTFRDNVVKTIEKTIERIPGASQLVEKITNALNKYIFTLLEPLLKPIMIQATAVLGEGSEGVIASNSEQFEVFDNPYASDPTHSFLSKDHFNMILNEPAGKIAIIIVSYTVKAIVKAWDSVEINPDSIANSVLKAFHHPYFYDETSEIQTEMGVYMKGWIESQNVDDKAYILNALTKSSVRAGRNTRKGHANLNPGSHDHSNRDVSAPQTYQPPVGPPPTFYQQEQPLPTTTYSSDVPSFNPNAYYPPSSNSSYYQQSPQGDTQYYQSPAQPPPNFSQQQYQPEQSWTAFPPVQFQDPSNNNNYQSQYPQGPGNPGTSSGYTPRYY